MESSQTNSEINKEMDDGLLGYYNPVTPPRKRSGQTIDEITQLLGTISTFHPIRPPRKQEGQTIDDITEMIKKLTRNYLQPIEKQLPVEQNDMYTERHDKPIEKINNDVDSDVDSYVDNGFNESYEPEQTSQNYCHYQMKDSKIIIKTQLKI